MTALSPWATRNFATATLLVTAFLGAARADAPPTKDARPAVGSVPPEKYEDAFVRSKLKKNALVPDPNPEGKTIEEILVEVEEIFDDQDQGQLAKVPIIGVAPRYANYLHATTKRYVAAREVLFDVGQPYRRALAAETERNLRGIVIFAIGRVVPCLGSAPNTVKVLVATKDLWSLRLETDFQVSGGRLDFLRMNVIERNLAGRYKLLSGILQITRDTFSVGQGFIEPRLLGTRIVVEEQAQITFGRGGRGIEGSSGRLSVGQPLYALATKWGFEGAVDYTVGVTRQFRGGDFFRCFTGDAPARILCDNEIRSAAQRNALLASRNSVTPVYETQVVTVGLAGVRRFGDEVKHDVSFGYGFRHRRFNLVGDFPDEGFRDAVRAQFLPRAEDASFVYAGYRTFDTKFTTLKNVNRFALTEDFQHGHDIRFLTRWANQIFGVNNVFVEVDGSAQYRWLLGGENLLTVAARGQSRADGTGLVDNRFTFLINNISPVLGVGRLIFEAFGVFRFDDRDNVRSTIGGNAGLRGYDSDEFRGRHAVNMHLEYRSLPVDILTLQVGFVGFYDAGHAADSVSQLKLRHSIGAGLRIYLPQVNRMVIRMDFGIPLNPGGPDSAGSQFAFSFDQAF